MNPLLIEGLTDAAGFVVGALIGFAVARLLGLDPLADGYGNSAIGGIVLCGLGGGAGVHIARRLRASRKDK
jgi:hypothetical protein